MRFLLSILLLACVSLPVQADRNDASPLIKAPPTIAPCLAACEKDFTACEAQPQAASSICPQSRRVCFERCDPAGLSTQTTRGLKRSDAELRYKPLHPMTPLQQCRQVCQDRRATCLSVNSVFGCDPATSACYDRCDTADKARSTGHRAKPARR